MSVLTKEAGGDLSLQQVLWLISFARFAAPTDQQQQWHAVNLPRGHRNQWVHRVAKTRVLQVDECRLSRRQVVAGSNAHRVALVGRNHVARRRHVACHVRAEILRTHDKISPL